MKKSCLLILLIFMLSVPITACRGIGGYQEGMFFTKDFLKSVSLDGMPVPDCESYALNNRTQGMETLKFETDLKGLEAYVNAFIAYMNTREDVYYFGEQECDSSIAEMLPHRIAQKIDAEFQWVSSVIWYSFAYSLTDELGGPAACTTHPQYQDPIIVKFEYDREEKIAYVNIATGDTFGSECIGESMISPD